MWYKCDDCGNLFEEGEEAVWTEDYGEKWSGCPCCKGSYEEVYPCKNCEKMGVKHQGDFCEECIVDVSKRLKNFLDDLTDTEKEILEEIDWS